MKTYYYLYKTTNLVNNKFYIGAHSTKNINDGYLGPGNAIREEIKFYGKEFFKKEILFYFENESEMYLMEEKIVSPYLLKKFNVYNLNIGGKGIFIENQHYYMDHEDYQKKWNCDGFPEFDEIINKNTDNNYNQIIEYLENELKNCLNEVKNPKKIECNYMYKRIFVTNKFAIFYKKFNVYNEKIINDLDSIIFKKMNGILTSTVNSFKYLICNIPVSYAMDEEFCDWFLKKYFNEFIIIENNHNQYFNEYQNYINFMRSIIDDHNKILSYDYLKKCIASNPQKKACHIKWLGENNAAMLEKKYKPKQKIKHEKNIDKKNDNIELEIKKAKIGSWWK